MAYRKVPEMSEETKVAVLRDLRAAVRRKKTADRRLASDIRDALTHGFTTRELGDELGASAASVSRWSRDAA